jgi:hypothetical protein
LEKSPQEMLQAMRQLMQGKWVDIKA